MQFLWQLFEWLCFMLNLQKLVAQKIGTKNHAAARLLARLALAFVIVWLCTCKMLCLLCMALTHPTKVALACHSSRECQARQSK